MAQQQSAVQEQSGSSIVISGDMEPQIHHVLIPRSALYFDRPIVFDLFVKLNGKYIKVLNEGEIADPERIDKYLQKKADVLYIQSTAIEKFMDQIFASVFEKATQKSHNEVELRESMRSFVRCAELCYLDLKLVRPHADKFMRLHMVAEAAFDFFKNQDYRRILLQEMLASIENSISRRAILATALGIAFFLEQGECSLLAFKSLFVGGVLRDYSVSLTGDTDPHLKFAKGELSEEELTAFFTHPQRSIDLLHPFNVLDDTMETLIRQHHEKPLGDGFPLGLKRVEIYQPAQFLYLADWMITEMENQNQFLSLKGIPLLIAHVQAITPEENQRRVPLLVRVLSRLA